MTAKPSALPARPHFSSGPCAKRPGWSPEQLDIASLGRSHRSKLGKARLKHAIDLTRKLLGIPGTHRIGIETQKLLYFTVSTHRLKTLIEQ